VIHILISVLSISLFLNSAFALDVLPLPFRAHSYSAYSTGVRGDLRTVGMAGATVGLADTFNAALDNPAGLAMTLNGADLNIASNQIYDGYIQDINFPIKLNDFGLAVNAYPWGFSFGYVQPSIEGQLYGLALSPTVPTNVTVAVRELHFSVARLFFDNKLSVGGSMFLGQAEDLLESSTASYSFGYHPFAIGASLGISYQPVPHILVGMSYQLPMHYGIDTLANPTPVYPNFFQSVDVPARLGFGAGWIPNRFFRADFTTFLVGNSPGCALLANDNVLVGQAITLQPRIGGAFNFLDYKELQSTLFLGSYYEVSRIQDVPNRFHGTGSIEVKPWVLNLGLGIDIADSYRNYLVSIGVDAIKIMEKLELIPKLWHPAPVGAFPRIVAFSDEGLPRPLVEEWNPHQDIDPIKLGLSIPKRVEKKAEQIGQSVKKITSEVRGALSSTPKVDPKKSKKKLSKKKKKP
jgi:hypothetical protein